MTTEGFADTRITEEEKNEPGPATKDFWDKVKVFVFVGSLLLNLLQAYWNHREQNLTAEKQAAAAEDRMRAEQRRVASEMLEKLWPTVLNGSAADHRVAMAAIRAIWPELAQALDDASKKSSPKTGPRSAIPAAPGDNGGGLLRVKEGVKGLVEIARTFESFQLYAQADRAYMEAAKNAGFQSQADKQKLAQGVAYFEADQFYEAAQVLQRLFEEVKE